MVMSLKRVVAITIVAVALGMAGPIAPQAAQLPPGLQAQIEAAVQSDNEAQVSEAVESLVRANRELAARIAAAAARIRPDLAAVIAAAATRAAPGAGPAIAAAVTAAVPEAAAQIAAAVAQAVPASAGAVFLAVANIVPEAAIRIAASVANAVPNAADTVATLLDESGLAGGAGPAPPVPAGFVSDTAENPATASPTGL